MIYNDNMNYFKKCLPSCLFKKEISNVNIEFVENISNKNNEKSKDLPENNIFKNMMNNMISFDSFKNSKKSINEENICKICHTEFVNENKICDCLVKDELHPDHKETKIKIYEKYIHNNEIINQAIHIDKNPEQLTILINDIYDIIEKSTLKDDLTPKRLEKAEENLINQICIHIEDYIKNKE